jgi:hypothetical protein
VISRGADDRGSPSHPAYIPNGIHARLRTWPVIPATRGAGPPDRRSTRGQTGKESRLQVFSPSLSTVPTASRAHPAGKSATRSAVSPRETNCCLSTKQRSCTYVEVHQLVQARTPAGTTDMPQNPGRSEEATPADGASPGAGKGGFSIGSAAILVRYCGGAEYEQRVCYGAGACW